MAWTDTTRQINILFEVDWDKNGVYTDESANVVSAQGTMAMLQIWQSIGGNAVQPSWQLSVELKNQSNRYSPLNAASPINADIATNRGYGIPVKLSVKKVDESPTLTEQLFAGYIDSMTVTSTRNRRVTINCLDNSHPILQRKVSTTISQNQYADDWIGTLATAANITSTDLDNGLRQIPYVWLDDENVWAEMCQTANADGGFLYFNRSGQLVFRNSESWFLDTVYNTSQHTFTVSNFLDVAQPFDYTNIYNEVVVVYASRVPTLEDTIYTLPRAFDLLPGESRAITARYRYPVTDYITPTSADYVIITAGGDDISADVTISVTGSAQRADVVFTNNNASDVAIISQFKIRGYPLIGEDADQKKYQATDSDIGNPTTGELKSFRVTGNAYVQTVEQADLLAMMLRDRLKKGRQSFTVQAQAIPTLEPGYLVTVSAAVDVLCYIQSINWSIQNGKYHATYNLIEATDWFIYSDYYELGTDAPNATTSQRIYY